MKRREFIYKSSMLGAGMLLSPTLTRAAGGKVGANDKIRVGLIGCNGMGFGDLQAFLKNKEVECVALADVDQGVLDRRVADVEKIQGRKPQGIYKDWRRLIDDKHVDVVIIGTPDHWHCLQLVAACEAGKDVYCEAAGQQHRGMQYHGTCSREVQPRGAGGTMAAQRPTLAGCNELRAQRPTWKDTYRACLLISRMVSLYSCERRLPGTRRS